MNGGEPVIKFLVRLANLLDKQGKYKLSTEVDDLIEKLAQNIDTGPNQETYQNLYQSSPDDVPGGMPDQINNINIAAKKILLQKYKNTNQILDAIHKKYPNQKTPDALWPAQELSMLDPEAYTALVVKYMPESSQALKQQLIDPVTHAIQSLRGVQVPVQQDPEPTQSIEPNTPPATWSGEPWQSREPVPVSSDVANKAPPKVPAGSVKNPKIIQIQTYLGIKPTGHWDSTTNNSFIAAMNSLPESAKMMDGGKFKGTLQDAARYALQFKDSKEGSEHRAPINQPVTPPPAAAKPKPQYKSNYDLRDIQDSINKLVAKGYGESVQNFIGMAGNAADAMRTPPGAAGLNQKQDGFERTFNQRASMYV